MKIIVGNAWPYANGPLHLGRIAVLLPGDIIARYHRLMGDDVIFLSGTDCHGMPVTMKAKEEGITPLEATIKYHEEFEKCFKSLGFSFDIFAKTSSKYHKDKVHEFILELYKKEYIYEKEVEQICCDECNEFLLDRDIEGICPICGGYVTGDKCGGCGEIIHINDVLNKRCKVCKSELRNIKTKHLFFTLSKFESDVRNLVMYQEGWRENAIKIVNRYLDEGLRDKAVTRDFNWGVDIPLEGYDDKKIFVWIEAVMGYLTASMKCLEELNGDFKEYWQGEDSRVYFVHGKDNIPFHTVIFPAILSGLNIKNPNLRIISSEYLKLEGKNFSSVKNWAIWGDYIVKKYGTDATRYYLSLNSPEIKDTDFTWKEFINTINNDLNLTFGSFINKTLTFSKKNLNSRIPSGTMKKELKDYIFNLYFEVGDKIEEGKFKSSLEDIFMLIKRGNKMFDEEKPWITIDNNRKQCYQTIYTCIQIIVNITNLLYPFIPSTCEKIAKSLRLEEPVWSFIEKKEGGIGDIDNLFEKIDKKRIIEELKRLKEEKF